MDSIGIADPLWLTTFPHRVAPRPEEWLAGVILRCDEANCWNSGTTITHLMRTAGTDADLEQMNLVLPASSFPFALLAGWLAVPKYDLISSTYQLELARLYAVSYPHIQLLDMGFSLHVCPVCLGEARMLRRSLVLPHIRCCPIGK